MIRWVSNLGWAQQGGSAGLPQARPCGCGELTGGMGAAWSTTASFANLGVVVAVSGGGRGQWAVGLRQACPSSLADILLVKGSLEQQEETTLMCNCFSFLFSF